MKVKQLSVAYDMVVSRRTVAGCAKIYHSIKPVVHNENNYECCFKCCDETNEESTSLLGNIIDV